jgi:hypothetical protein
LAMGVARSMPFKQARYLRLCSVSINCVFGTGLATALSEEPRPAASAPVGTKTQNSPDLIQNALHSGWPHVLGSTPRTRFQHATEKHADRQRPRGKTKPGASNSPKREIDFHPARNHNSGYQK